MLTRTFPVVGDRLAPAAAVVIPALASALGASNASLRAEAGCALDSMCASVDAAVLVQPLCQVGRAAEREGGGVGSKGGGRPSPAASFAAPR